MTFDHWLKLLGILKWPLAVVLLAAVGMIVFRIDVKGLVAGLRARRFKFGGTELGPEQSPAAAQTAITVAVAANPNPAEPHPFEASDNAYFQFRKQELARYLAGMSFATPAEKERWLIREGAGLVIRIEFEQLYRTVWASQMELLGAANRPDGVPLDTARAGYEVAKSHAAQVYANYSFEQWLGFMSTSNLIRQDGQQIHTTPKAKLFIQFLVERGYDLHGMYKNW